MHQTPPVNKPQDVDPTVLLTAALSGARPLFDPEILAGRLKDSFVKLNPITLMRNPVMFVVEVGAALGHVSSDPGPVIGAPNVGFGFQISLWLWFTVLFANFAEAMAEARGKAQADTLRKTKTDAIAKRLTSGGRVENVPASKLRSGDMVICEAGDLIPGDGEVIEGIATVDESVITGESAPVIRESGGDRSAVTGGTKVLSDQIRIRITSNPGETFLDRMIALVEGAERQKTPNEIALNILIAGLTLIFLLAVVTLQPYAIYSVAAAGSGSTPTVAVLVSLLVCLIPTTIGGLAVRDRHRRHGSRDAAQRARDERQSRRSFGRRQHAAARQDRHHHDGQSPGGGVHSGERRSRWQNWPMRRNCRAWPMRRRRAGRWSCLPRRSTACAAETSVSTKPLHSVHRLHPNERRRLSMAGSFAKGATDSIAKFVRERGGAIPAEFTEISERIARSAERRWRSPTARACSDSFT